LEIARIDWPTGIAALITALRKRPTKINYANLGPTLRELRRQAETKVTTTKTASRPMAWTTMRYRVVKRRASGTMKLTTACDLTA